MAVEKGKVLAAIEAKVKGKSLTKNFKDRIAEKWAAKIESEEGIDEYINDREDVILEASIEGDRRATQASAKAKQEAVDALSGKTETEAKVSPEATTMPDDTPAWAKAILEQNKTFAQEIAAMKQAKTAETIADRFNKDPRLAGIPDFMKKRAIPTDDGEYDAAVEGLVNDWKPFAEANKLAGFGQDTPPASSGGGAATTGKVDPDIVAFGKQKVAALTEKN